MPKQKSLNQIVAIEKSLKTKKHQQMTALYHDLQKPQLFNGLSRTYAPFNDDGEQLNPEKTIVQKRVRDVLSTTKRMLADLFEITALKDFTNQEAKADLEVDGLSLVKNAPVSYLLWLEKELSDLHAFVQKIPVLDPSEIWQYDQNSDSHLAQPTKTIKTKKIKRVITKAEATEKHPAQVEVYDDDATVGHWTTIKSSGAASQKDVTAMLERVENVQRACKFAREIANQHPVVESPNTGKILDYVFQIK